MRVGFLKMLSVVFIGFIMCTAVYAKNLPGEQQQGEQQDVLTKIRMMLQEVGWRIRTYESPDQDIWGNRGIGVGGYIVGSPPGAAVSIAGIAPQMLSEPELKRLKDEISTAMQTVKLQKKQREELEYYLSQVESQLASYKENFEVIGGGTYIVKKDDSLWRIARDQYGDANKWPLIYRANQDKISNPNIIYAGQELQVPQLKIRK